MSNNKKKKRKRKPGGGRKPAPYKTTTIAVRVRAEWKEEVKEAIQTTINKLKNSAMYTITETPMQKHINNGQEIVHEKATEREAVNLFHEICDRRNINEITTDKGLFPIEAGGIGYDWRITMTKN